MLTRLLRDLEADVDQVLMNKLEEAPHIAEGALRIGRSEL